MGHQEAPEHEAPLRAGKGKRAETGAGKYRKEGKCSLDLMLKQTIFWQKPSPSLQTQHTKFFAFPSSRASHADSATPRIHSKKIYVRFHFTQSSNFNIKAGVSARTKYLKPRFSAFTSSICLISVSLSPCSM